MALCLNVLEHLERDNGNKMIQPLERAARETGFMIKPVGENKQLTYEGNPYQKHRCIRMPDKPERFGYRVREVGIRNIGGEGGLVSRLPKIVKSISHVVWARAILFANRSALFSCFKRSLHICCIFSPFDPIFETSKSNIMTVFV